GVQRGVSIFLLCPPFAKPTPLILGPGCGGGGARRELSEREGRGEMTTKMITQPRERSVEISSFRRKIRGALDLPRNPAAVVAFAHGSGSGRYSPRNQFVASVLQSSGMATLLIDLLEEDEAEDRRKVFDIDLLADRLRAAAYWLGQDEDTRGLP